MKGNIAINVKYTENDFVRGMKFATERSKPNWFNAILFAVSIMVGIGILYGSILRPEGAWKITDTFLLSMALLASVPLSIALKNVRFVSVTSFSRMYKNSPLLQENYHIVFSDDGIVSTSDSLDNTIRWPAILEFKESEDDVFFFLSPYQPYFIPKRNFSPDQLIIVRRLALDSLGDKCH